MCISIWYEDCSDYQVECKQIPAHNAGSTWIDVKKVSIDAQTSGDANSNIVTWSSYTTFTTLG
jgi:hypothetical protein